MGKKSENFIALYRLTNNWTSEVFEGRGWRQIADKAGCKINISQARKTKKWTVEILEYPAVWDEGHYRKKLYQKSRDRYPQYEQQKLIKDPLYEKRKRLRTNKWKNPDGSNFTAEQYDEWSKKSCFICASQEQIKIDHCHRTNIVRKPLCHRCNIALGMVDDSTERLYNMILYLKAHNYANTN